jgi:phage tail-like protein
MPVTPESLLSTHSFILSVPDIDTVGQFSHCSGLEMWFETFQYAEGGNNDFVHTLPGRLRFPNLLLTRGFTKSEALLQWFAKTQTKADIKQVTLTIKEGDNQRVLTFADAFPVRWTGPSFDANTTGLGTESLEIAHSGLTLPSS